MNLQCYCTAHVSWFAASSSSNRLEAFRWRSLSGAAKEFYQLQISTTENSERDIQKETAHNQTSSSDNSELLSMESSPTKSAILFQFFERGLGQVKPLTTLAQTFVYLFLTLSFFSRLLSSIHHSFVVLWRSGI